MFQTILVIIICSASLMFLARRFWKQFFTKNEGCEGCAIGKTTTLNAKDK